jgi:hypothetical protein
VSIDAMLLSHEVGLPTLNGYSGQVPDGWALKPWLPEYAANIGAWIERYDMTEGVCTYDLSAHTWSSP